MSSIGSLSTSGINLPTTSSSSTTSTPTLSSNSLNTNGITFSGVASGIDTSSIITGLEKISNQKIAQYQAQQTTITGQQTAVATVQSSLLSFQATTTALAASVNGAFDGRTATPSDATVLSATADSTAVSGTYTLSVNNLATAATVASAGYADANTRLQTGTLSIQVGSGAATTITLDNNNNTLQGLATAINNAGTDVQAAVINDGSSSPYRLMLTSTKTGAANTISITNNLTSGSGASINPEAVTLQTATDASLSLGSGTNALSITSPTNQVSSVIPGVTLNLLAAKPNTLQTITVANDVSGATTAIQNFVTAYNSLVDTVNTQTSFDSTTNTAGPLLGDPNVDSLQTALNNALTSSVSTSLSSLKSLSGLGITLDTNGHLQVNSTTLNSVLSGNTGATMATLKSLFGLTGSSNSTAVQFVLGNSKTQASGLGSYQVNITQAATQGSAVATTAAANSITIDNTNNTLNLNVNGHNSTSLQLTNGTYTPAQLVVMLQQQVTNNSGLAGVSASVGLNSNGSLQITSQQYGSGSSVSVTGGTALSALGFNGTESGRGVDIQGNFVVNGQTETATGNGQLLTGSSTNANTSGLVVRGVSSSPTSANLTVTNGIAGQLNKVLNTYLDPTNGKLATATQSYQTAIKAIQTNITNVNNQIAAQTQQLTLQFANMETTISTLKNLQGSLIALIPQSSSSSSSSSG